MPFKIQLILIIICTITYNFIACKKGKTAEGIDRELFDMASSSQGVIWFKNSNTQLNRSSGSGHSQPYLKTRYNAIAATNLDVNGKIKQGSIFSEGAMVVKELIDNSSSVVRYAILYKKQGSPDADSKGWVWGYINADGSVAETASNKGKSCIGCHSQADNIDYMLMNKYFP